VTEEVTSQKWIAVEGEDTYETSTFEQCIDFPIQDHQWVFYPNQECDVEILKSGRGVVSWKESCPDPDIADGRTETLIRTEYSRHETKRRIDIEVYGESIDSEVPLTRKEMEMRSTWSGSKCPE
jgi:hypothetical protein